MIVAGDVGGTKTRLAWLAPGSTPRSPAREWRRPSRDYPSLEALVTAFLDGGPPPSSAVLGIAGPVVENRCETTNLPWAVDGDRLARALGIGHLVLLNDLEATAHGLAMLGPEDLETLQPGTPRAGNRALIAAGTGLGEAVLARSGDAWRPLATEGGHVDFGPRDALEDELNGWLRARHGHVSYERVLSGAGLADLYRFLSDTGRGRQPDGFAAAFADDEDPAAMVSAAALDGSCERARMAVGRFVTLYGAEAGNLALKSLAVNGVFVAGGIAPRLLPFLRDGGFMEAFRSKGRLAPLLERIPVAVVLDDRAALWGAAALALAGPAERPA